MPRAPWRTSTDERGEKVLALDLNLIHGTHACVIPQHNSASSSLQGSRDSTPRRDNNHMTPWVARLFTCYDPVTSVPCIERLLFSSKMIRLMEIKVPCIYVYCEG